MWFFFLCFWKFSVTNTCERYFLPQLTSLKANTDMSFSFLFHTEAIIEKKIQRHFAKLLQVTYFLCILPYFFMSSCVMITPKTAAAYRWDYFFSVHIIYTCLFQGDFFFRSSPALPTTSYKSLWTHYTEFLHKCELWRKGNYGTYAHH